jgi:hypothetical protein
MTSMKTILLWALGIVVLILIAIVVLYFTFPKGSGTSTQPSTTFPISNTATTKNNQSSGNTAQGVMTLSTNGGGTLATLDFVHNGVTLEDPENKGNYYLAGNTGYCYANGTCQNVGSTTDFAIEYFPKGNVFVVGLSTEPLGKVRTEAQTFLLNDLGITQAQACSLNYSVMTADSVNEQYAGQNLGFSFCSGAVELPQ